MMLCRVIIALVKCWLYDLILASHLANRFYREQKRTDWKNSVNGFVSSKKLQLLDN